MKRLVYLAIMLGGLASVYGQGKVQFANIATTDSRLWLYTSKDGNRAIMPTKNAGPVYNVGFFYEAVGTSVADFKSLMVINQAPTSAGKFTTAAPTVPAPFNTGALPINFQIRAWSSELGATWADVLTKVDLADPMKPVWKAGQSLSGDAFVGASIVGTTQPTSSPTGQPGAIFGFNAGQVQGFDMYVVVPEPSTLAIGLVGLAGLILIRRRK